MNVTTRPPLRNGRFGINGGPNSPPRPSGAWAWARRWPSSGIRAGSGTNPPRGVATKEFVSSALVVARCRTLRLAVLPRHFFHHMKRILLALTLAAALVQAAPPEKLELKKDDHIAIVGNELADRMQH